MSNYEVILETSIQGIPCKIGVWDYIKVPPWKGSVMTCPSDLDYYGYTDISYEILKMNETSYPWLEKKMTSKDYGMVEDEISEYFDNLKDLEDFRYDTWKEYQEDY